MFLKARELLFSLNKETSTRTTLHRRSTLGVTSLAKIYSLTNHKRAEIFPSQGYNVRKVNCSGIYSVYILKQVLSGRNL